MVANWQHTDVAPGDIVIAAIFNKHQDLIMYTHRHMHRGTHVVGSKMVLLEQLNLYQILKLR